MCTEACDIGALKKIAVAIRATTTRQNPDLLLHQLISQLAFVAVNVIHSGRADIDLCQRLRSKDNAAPSNDGKVKIFWVSSISSWLSRRGL